MLLIFAPGLLLLANEAPDIKTVMSWVDFGTLGLLFGMMLVVGQVSEQQPRESTARVGGRGQSLMRS